MSTPSSRGPALAVGVLLLALASAASANPPKYPEARTRRQFSASDRDFLPLLRLAVKVGKVFAPGTEQVKQYMRVGELLLAQSSRIGFREQRLPADATTAKVHDFYREWATQQDYCECMRSIDGAAESWALVKHGPEGGLVYLGLESGQLRTIWAKGHVDLGPLAAEWLGLPKPKGTEVELAAEIPPPTGEPLPPLPVPDNAQLDLEIRLTRSEIVPMAREILSRSRDPEEGKFGIASLLGVGDQILANVREIKYQSLVVDRAHRDEVVQAYEAWAQKLGWEEVFYGEGQLLGESQAALAAKLKSSAPGAEAPKAPPRAQPETLGADSKKAAAEHKAAVPHKPARTVVRRPATDAAEDDEVTWGLARMDANSGALIIRAKGDQLMVARLDGAVDLAAALTAMFGTPEELDQAAEELEKAAQEQKMDQDKTKDEPQGQDAAPKKPAEERK